MIHIILLILKILGCILLGILALLLVILLIGLFVPFRYRLSGKFCESSEADVSLRWLFGALRIQGALRGKAISAKAKFLWLTLFDTQKEKGDTSLTDIDASVFEDEETVFETVSEAADVAPAQEPSDDDKTAEVQTEARAEFPKAEIQQISEPGSRAEAIPAPKKNFEKKPAKEAELPKLEKTPLSEKLKGRIEKISQFFEKIGHKKDVAERFWNAQCTQNSIAFVKRALMSILKHIRPKKISGNIRFGMDRPADTGRILGAVSIICPLWGRDLKVIPDFERQIFEGELFIQGSVRLYIFVYWILRGLLSKDIRKLIKYIKYIKNKEATLWQ